jgi:hypothetical protein
MTKVLSLNYMKFEASNWKFRIGSIRQPTLIRQPSGAYSRKKNFNKISIVVNYSEKNCRKFFHENILRENFRANFLIFFSRNLFRENICANFFAKITKKYFSRNIFRHIFAKIIFVKIIF